MSKPRLFTISREGRGALSTTAAPAGAQQLSPFLSALKGQGVDVLVSLLPPREEGRLGLANEEGTAASLGIEFLRLPTRDFRAPGLIPTQNMVTVLVDRLARGLRVVIHCRAGVGRASTLAAAVLVREGVAPDQAWRRVSAARGERVPETRSQRRLIDQLRAADSTHGSD